MTDDFFDGVTQKLSEEEKKTILRTVYSQLEERVGDKVVDMVSDEQFSQFESLVDQEDETKINEWLKTNVPTYDQMVESILEELKQEVAANPQTFLGD